MAGPMETNKLVNVRDTIYAPSAAEPQASNRAKFSGLPLPIVSKSARMFLWRLNWYLLVPGRYAFLIFHGITEAFGLDAELA